ncbi:MAG: arginine--tRNA ligase [bacterium]|nr:arginine--tRNA ligase [bacterium]
MLREEIEKTIEKTVKTLYREEVEVGIERPQDPVLGDYSSNVAMVLKKNPQEIADALKGPAIFEKIEAKNGFVNFFVSKDYLQKQVGKILGEGKKFGRLEIGKGQKVNVEFISANPTGPLTVGNSRGGIIGDVLSNILDRAGWRVTREYYFNDAGGQIDVLGHSVLQDDLAEYKGDYIDELHNKLGGKGDAREIGKKAAKILIEEIKKTTKKIGIKFDVWTAEGRDLREKGKVEKIISWIKKEGLSYEEEGALWFKSTQFGDDKDRVLIKSDGQPTYFAVDCAYHKNKLVERKFAKAIDIWGADHHGDISRIKGFVKALGQENKLDILIHQFVRIVKDGQEVRMSKRAGNYITIEDLLSEVGLDITRFFFLTKSPSTHLNFDLGLAKEKSDKNPVYYVQYAHARICSILKKAGAKYKIQNVKYQLLNHASELALLKELIRFPEVIEDTVKDYQVQRLPQYAAELATAFHRFYRDCRVITDDKELSRARLSLVLASKIVLKNTLDLMGVSAPEKM